jgi:hypothetical protein
MITGEEIDEWEMPHWAKEKAHGDYTLPMAQLPTRDGRRCGNALNCGLAVPQRDPYGLTYLIVTDAGTILKLNRNEMMEMFHPPEFIMDRALPAQIQAIEEMELGTSSK